MKQFQFLIKNFITTAQAILRQWHIPENLQQAMLRKYKICENLHSVKQLLSDWN